MGITKEQIVALVGDNSLTEDTFIKLKVMVENAINEKVKEAVSDLEEKIAAYEEYAISEVESLTEEFEAEKKSLMEKAEAYSDYVVQEMTEKVDSYSEYVVEKFVEENQGKLVETNEYNKMKKVFDAIKETFEVAGFELNESAPAPIDPNTELQSKFEESKTSFNELFDQYQAVIKENEEMHYAIIFEHLTKDLADTQIEKVKALVENVSFDGVHEFKRAVELMIEQISSSKEVAETVVTENTTATIQEIKEGSVAMERYLNFL